MICTLEELVSQYCVLRPMSRGAAYLLRRSVRLYGEWLGRVGTVNDLTDVSVSRWLSHLEGSASAWTRAGHRTRMLSLWRFAARRMLCSGPGEIRREPAPEPQPEAWTLEQVDRLLAACEKLPDEARDYFRALILGCYESGLRLGDIRRVGRHQIRQDGTICGVRQHKTKHPHEPRFTPSTAAAVLALPGQFPLACPWGTRKYSAFWRQLRSLAGLSSGACQQLRRTGATWVAVTHGLDAAREFLGHRSPEMVDHYVDRTIYKPRGWLPPPINQASG